MKNKLFFSTLLALLVAYCHLHASNIGLLIVATGKYTQFLDPLINSAEKYFCKEHKVTFYVFTDDLAYNRENAVVLYHPKLGWPFDTMLRYQAYSNYRYLLLSEEYLFALDADMLFVDEVGSEILGERVAVQHPGFVGRRGSYDSNIHSTAYVGPHEGKIYYAGGFYGGSSAEFFKIIDTNINNIEKDLSSSIIAVWHDESHWNRYCIDTPPTVVLSPSYCYPEKWNLPYKKRILALDKNHGEFQK